MSFPVIVRPLAERDLLDAQLWYNDKSLAVGTRFRQCVDDVLQILTMTPLIFPTAHRDVRRATVQHFPYLLYYAVRRNRVLVLGCFHARRDPQVIFRRITARS